MLLILELSYLKLKIMYYLERVIDGILCYRLTPNGTWHELSNKELTKRLLAAEAKISELTTLMEEED
jgi:hypothetical protein